MKRVNEFKFDLNIKNNYYLMITNLKIVKQHLIEQIEEAFINIKLEDGIGLWEGQGLDDYATPEECKKLREKDEKEDWHKISVINLYKCNSSLSFFDAKGMRFHLPQLLLLGLDVFEKEENELHKKGGLKSGYCPDLFFTLTYNLESDYSINRFSALNNEQIKCVLKYFEYKIQEREAYYKEFGIKSKKDRDDYFNEIKNVMIIWKNKLQ